jgi:hypothetical protein
MVRIPFRQIVALVIVLCAARPLVPCPFCSALSSTISDDMKESHWAFLAVCVVPADTKNPEIAPIHQFKLVTALKSPSNPTIVRPPESSPISDTAKESEASRVVTASDQRREAAVKLGDIVEVYSSQAYSKNEVVLLLGNSLEEETDWAASAPLTAEGQAYIKRLVALNKTVNPKDRLHSFLPALRSRDKLVATDAYNEFAVASLEVMNGLKTHLHSKDVIAAIEDPQTTNELRRLHWTLLAICGSAADLPFVELAMQANLANENGDIGMDAVFSCYIVLGGEKALERLEREYFGNPNSSYTNCFALVAAMRVHAEQIKTIDKKRISQSFRMTLSRGNLAELVIPDLARWEDWSVIDPLVELFSRPANGERQSYKIPIVNYLRNCPLPEAQAALARCEQLDPEAVRRTTVLFPLRIPAADRHP